MGLHGWDRLTCTVVLLNALGGFAVSLTMKYADNILKTFAVSMSLVLNCVFSSVFLSTSLTINDTVGVGFVIAASLLYSRANSINAGDGKYVTLDNSLAGADDGSDIEKRMSPQVSGD